MRGKGEKNHKKGACLKDRIFLLVPTPSVRNGEMRGCSSKPISVNAPWFVIQWNPKYGCKGTVTTRFALIALVAWKY